MNDRMVDYRSRLRVTMEEREQIRSSILWSQRPSSLHYLHGFTLRYEIAMRLGSVLFPFVFLLPAEEELRISVGAFERRLDTGEFATCF